MRWGRDGGKGGYGEGREEAVLCGLRSGWTRRPCRAAVLNRKKERVRSGRGGKGGREGTRPSGWTGKIIRAGRGRQGTGRPGWLGRPCPKRTSPTAADKFGDGEMGKRAGKGQGGRG